MLSHWLTEAGLSTDDAAPALEGDVRADVCIIGGGFCGLWTAIRLKQRDPSIDIAIVEQGLCGSGASGRNGGFVLSWWAKFGSLLQDLPLGRSGPPRPRFRRCRGRDRPVLRRQWDRPRTIAATAGFGLRPARPQVGSWDALVDTLERYQEHPFELWEPETVKRRSGTDKHIAGVYEPTGATVQPAMLAHGLRRTALSLGVRIYEQTPMMSLHRGRPPRVVTPRGIVTAEKVVIAMNAWSTMFPELRRTVVVNRQRHRGDPADARNASPTRATAAACASPILGPW